MLASNRSAAATGSGADADRMNRTAGGTDSSGPSVLRRETMAGTALIQVMERLAIRSQKPLRWNRSSRTRLDPATRADSRPTTSALMWKSGSGLNPRSSLSSWRCDATERAVWSSCTWLRRTTLGVPVVPDDERTTPPAPARCGAVAPGRVARPSSRCSRRSNSTHSVSIPAGAGWSASTRPTPVRDRATARPPLPLEGMDGLRGATQKPVLTAPRKASANATGSLMTRPMVVSPRARTPPSEARHRSMLRSSWRKDRDPAARACST